MDIIEEEKKIVKGIKENLLDASLLLEKKQKAKTKNVMILLDNFLFFEQDNPNLQKLNNKIRMIVKLLEKINDNEQNIEIKKFINTALIGIIQNINKWIAHIKEKFNEIMGSNEHLTILPKHKDPDKFYVMVKELNLNRHMLRHPINEIQLRNQMKRSNEVLIKHDKKDPISGSRVFSKKDSILYPGSTLVIKDGHHRLFELYRRYIQGRINGNTLIEFEIKY